MINTSKTTVREFRELYNQKGCERLLNDIIKIRSEIENKFAFDAFLMVLIGSEEPGSSHLDIMVKGERAPSRHSFKNNFRQNGNKFWNYKNADGLYCNLLFGDKVETKDGRKMSDEMKSFIQKDVNLDDSIDDFSQDLIGKIKNSTFLNSTVRQDRLERLNNCYDQFRRIFESGEGEKVSGISVKKSSIIHDKLKKLLKNDVRQIILTGAPGTGKTFYSQKFAKEFATAGEIGKGRKYEFVQFHSSYDYTDFVEGIRPAQVESGKTEFVKLDGVFKRFCRKVVENNKNLETSDEGKAYFFIIDEINRADLSRVFGELMYGLEENYRDKPFNTQYSNLPTYEIKNNKATQMEKDVFEEGFFIPKNVYIIGTMNDIDRSVEAFDFALRRRFQWIEVKANDVMKEALEEMQSSKEIHDNIDVINLVESAIALNDIISGEEGKKFGLSDAYHIGPAYLKTKLEDTLRAKKEIWEYRIEPILKEYCRGYNDTNQFINKCNTAFIGDRDDKE
ncbi:McrB family protein [Priestia sp. TGN 0903]|uniref:McrB family protein n=1 Tax=Priestia sp. TGN 0903 TaxID=3420730 RepID=UPI003D76DA19